MGGKSGTKHVGREFDFLSNIVSYSPGVGNSQIFVLLIVHKKNTGLDTIPKTLNNTESSPQPRNTLQINYNNPCTGENLFSVKATFSRVGKLSFVYFCLQRVTKIPIPPIHRYSRQIIRDSKLNGHANLISCFYEMRTQKRKTAETSNSSQQQSCQAQQSIFRCNPFAD